MKRVPTHLLALLVWLGLCPLALITPAAEEVAPALTNAADAQLLQNVQRLQDQLRATQKSVEQAREEAQAEARRAAEQMAARLNLIEQTLNTQRQQEMDSMRRSTNLMLVIVGGTAVIGFLAILFSSLAQARAMNRLTDVSRQLQLALPTAGGTELALPAARESLEAASANLLGAIDRLQHRLADMEQPAAPGSASNGGPATKALPATTSVTALLAKGQAMLNQNQTEDALRQFEEVLRLDPASVEALIKRGTALEKMDRFEEAIAAYDQAIVADGSQATAYLFKAGLYNRQKKYAEALQCYEKALNAQQNKPRGNGVSKN